LHGFLHLIFFSASRAGNEKFIMAFTGHLENLWPIIKMKFQADFGQKPHDALHCMFPPEFVIHMYYFSTFFKIIRMKGSDPCPLPLLHARENPPGEFSCPQSLLNSPFNDRTGSKLRKCSNQRNNLFLRASTVFYFGLANSPHRES